MSPKCSACGYKEMDGFVHCPKCGEPNPLYKDRLACPVCSGEAYLSVRYEKEARGGKGNPVIQKITYCMTCTFCPHCGRRM